METGIVRYSAAQLGQKCGEGRSDWELVRAKSEAELEQDIASDPDWTDVPRNRFKEAESMMPFEKKLLSLRLDADVIAWFRAQGPGYQTRINAVLRTYMREGQRRAG